MEFAHFLGRHVFVAIIATLGIILLAIGYAQEADAIMTSFQSWAWQAAGAAFFIIAVIMILFRYDQQQARAVPPATTPLQPPPRSSPRNNEAPAVSPVTEAPRVPQHGSPKEGRTYVSAQVTPGYLMSLCMDKTSHQGKQLTQPFIGKWMRVSGPFRDLRMVNDNLAQVSLEPSEMFSLFYFRNDFERLEILRPGEEIAIEGRIDKIAVFGIELEDCELVEP